MWYWGIIGGLVIAMVVFLALYIRTSQKLSQKERSETSDSVLQVRLESIEKTLNTRLQQNTDSVSREIREQSKTSLKLVENITREITEVKETSREVLSFTEQLQRLEQILKNPQQRGILGEYALEQIITNILPPGGYSLQYTFPKSNVRADAVLFLQDGKLVAIDAKFPLANYSKLIHGEFENIENVRKQLREDIKQRIQETAKYVIPQENTLEYAFMFIPSESLYYDILTQKVGEGGSGKNMIEYAFNEHRVIIISPTTLSAYIQTVSVGLRSLRIEENADKIMKQAASLRKQLLAYTAALQALGKSLTATMNHYDKAEKSHERINKEMSSLVDIGADSEQIES